MKSVSLHILLKLQCCRTRENKSPIVAGDEEFKSSNFVEVEMLGDGFPLLEK